MSTRDSIVSIRLTESNHKAVGRAAQAQALKVSEWVRQVVLSRLSGGDAAPVSHVCQCFAIRVLTLNVLLHLGPPQRGLSPERLKEIWQAADQLADQQARRHTRVVLARHPAGGIRDGRPTTSNRRPPRRVADSQRQTVALAAEAARVDRCGLAP